MTDISRRELLLGLGVTALGTACRAALPDCPVCTRVKTITLDAPHPLDNVALVAERCQLFAFDEIHTEKPTVYTPTSIEDIKSIFREAGKQGRRVTVRGGGQSLDAQSLNDDLVMMMSDKFSDIGCIERDDKGFFITTGAGAKWWNVVKHVAPYGLMPPSLATAGWATVAGTMSADCVSRMSPIVGKEGQQIRAFHIVHPNGVDGWYCREDKDEKGRVFKAVIGSFGALGAVTQVKFDLMVARTNPGVFGDPPCVFTRSTRHGNAIDWDTTLRTLQSKTKLNGDRFKVNRAAHVGAKLSKSELQKKKQLSADAEHTEAHVADDTPELARTPEWSALSIVSFVNGQSMSANVLEQRYVDSQPLRRLYSDMYDADARFPSGAELQIPLLPTLTELGIELGFPEGEFVDELLGWSFFLHNSLNPAKAAAHRCGERLSFTQQTFALPAGGDDGPVDTRPAQRFIELLMARVHEADIRPGDIDFLYVPGDEFLMSGSYRLTAFVITVSFAEMNRPAFTPEITETLRALSHDCRTLGGRVHLVKGVVADPADLRVMYGDAAVKLRDMKKTYDPMNILRNDFFERVFNA